MEDEPARTPSPGQEITAKVTVTGERAALLRDLAAVLGRTPGALALEFIVRSSPRSTSTTPTCSPLAHVRRTTWK